MRKRVLSSTQDAADAAVDWLYLEPLVEVEITSEDPAWPVESALLPGGGPGWRAAGAGSQTIRLVFDAPQSLHRIRLEFRETKTERTQEYVIRWSADGGQEFREVIRQRWNFSPGGSTHQVEDHAVDLRESPCWSSTSLPTSVGGALPLPFTSCVSPDPGDPATWFTLTGLDELDRSIVGSTHARAGSSPAVGLRHVQPGPALRRPYRATAGRPGHGRPAAAWECSGRPLLPPFGKI